MLSVDPAVGDVLIYTGASYDVNLVSVTGGGVTTWMKAVRDGTTDNIELWYGVVASSGQRTITIDGTGTTRSIWGHVAEVSGLGAVDTTATGAGTTETVASVSIDDLGHPEQRLLGRPRGRVPAGTLAVSREAHEATRTRLSVRTSTALPRVAL